MTVHVFISYSHKDRRYLSDDSLLGFLKGLEKEDVAFWYDDRITAGETWDQTIRDQIERADVALVLVSQSFLNSVYCMDIEMQALLGRRQSEGLQILPVILSACDWKSHAWLSETQYLPREGKNVERHYRDRGTRTELFFEILQHLRTIIRRVRTTPTALTGPLGTLPDTEPPQTGTQPPDDDALWGRVRRLFPGYIYVGRFTTAGGAPVFVVRNADGMEFCIKRLPKGLVTRTAGPLLTAKPYVVEEEYLRHGNDVFVFRPYVKGVSLAEIVQRNATPVQGALLGAWAVAIMTRLAELHKADPPVVHRDISPGNIIVDRGSIDPYLIDFKSAVVCDRATSVVPVGTPPFVAPEQLRGLPCPASDLYSLGMVLVYLTTFELPPTASVREARGIEAAAIAGPITHDRDGADPVHHWLPHLISMNPADRFQNAIEALRSRVSTPTIPFYYIGVLDLGGGVRVDMSSLWFNILPQQDTAMK